MEYLPRENLGEGFGVGIFPILEILGQADTNDITFPASYAIETEVCNALRAALPPSTIPAAEFEAAWAGEACPEANGTLRCRWPNPGKDLSNRRKGNNTSSGNDLPSHK